MANQDFENAGKTAREILMQGLSRAQSLEDKQKALMEELQRYTYKSYGAKTYPDGKALFSQPHTYRSPAQKFINPKIDVAQLPEEMRLITYILPPDTHVDGDARPDVSLRQELLENNSSRTKVIKIYVSYEED